MSDNWPKHADGTNKTVGEMTPEEKRGVLLSAAKRLEDVGDWVGGRMFRNLADKTTA